MAEYGPAVGRNEILAILILDSRCLRLWIDAPLMRKPTSVKRICRYETYGCDQHDNKCVHTSNPH